VAASAEEPIAAVAAAVGPAVVQIETARGLGSGVLYDTEGHILTAGHVVADGRGTVTVRLSDGTTRPGKVLGADTTADIAVVSIDPSGLSLTPAVLATGVPVVVGQTAVAVGSPFGLDQTVTAGIISAVNRPFSTTNAAIDMLQTDAPINPGNSGGALADRQGRIIGINDAIASSSGSNAGVGFAIPIDTAKAVADQIVAGQPVTFAFLGISSRDGGSGLVGSGAVVAEVSPASPAATAGLEVGDVVTAIDGTIVTGSVDLGAAIRAHQPGDSITLTLNRNGRTLTQAVTLGSTQD
jgi:putative serine protease PepD